MTHRMKTIGLAAVAAAAFGAAAVSAAPQDQNTNAPRPPFSRMGPPRGGLMGLPFGIMGLAGRMAERLELSDAQKDQLKAIAAAHRDEFRALAERASTARQALTQAVMADPVNDAAIQQASAGLAAVESDLAVAAAHVRAEMFQVLTDDQKATLKQMAAERPRARARTPRT
jgi:Spy/CpxP family protein refolding chaperone